MAVSQLFFLTLNFTPNSITLAKMRAKLSKLLIRRNHKNTNTATVDDASSSSSSIGVDTYRKKKNKKKIPSIYGFVLPKKIRSVIRNALTRRTKPSSSSNESKDDGSEDVDAEETRNVSSPERESVEQQNYDDENVVPAANKKHSTEGLPGFIIKKLKRATSGNLARVRSFRSNSFRRARSTCKEIDETEAGKTEIREELCKKRILMGEKCRPLHASGALHYDDNGILLPEEIL